MPDLTRTQNQQPPNPRPLLGGSPFVISVSDEKKNGKVLKKESVLFDVAVAKTYDQPRLASMIKDHLSGAMLQFIDLSQIYESKCGQVSFSMHHDSQQTESLQAQDYAKLRSEIQNTPFRNYADISRIISGLHHNTSNTFPSTRSK